MGNCQPLPPYRNKYIFNLLDSCSKDRKKSLSARKAKIHPVLFADLQKGFEGQSGAGTQFHESLESLSQQVNLSLSSESKNVWFQMRRAKDAPRVQWYAENREKCVYILKSDRSMPNRQDRQQWNPEKQQTGLTEKEERKPATASVEILNGRSGRKTMGVYHINYTIYNIKSTLKKHWILSACFKNRNKEQHEEPLRQNQVIWHLTQVTGHS